MFVISFFSKQFPPVENKLHGSGLLRHYEVLYPPFRPACTGLHNIGMEKKKRASFRFTAEPGTLVQIQQPAAGNEPIFGLAVDEAYRGCSFVITGKKPLWKEGEILKLKVGKLAAMLGEIRWIKKVEKNIWTIGVRYLE